MKKMSLMVMTILLVGMWACNQMTSSSDEGTQEEQVKGTADNALSEAEIAAGWTLLFDGTTTEQWRGYKQAAFPEKGWEATNGKLIITRGGGDLITKRQYGNFELVVDYKIHKEGGNSGIFYFVVEPKADMAIWNNAPEFQLIDNEYHTRDQDSSVYWKHLAGDNYDLHASVADYSKPVGEWNTAKIVHKDGYVEHWLNGQKTVAYEVGSEDWKKRVAASKFSQYPDYGLAKKGHIGLQDHGNTFSFKNLKIREL